MSENRPVPLHELGPLQATLRAPRRKCETVEGGKRRFN